MGGNCASRAERETDQKKGWGVCFSDFSAGFFGFWLGCLLCDETKIGRALGRAAVCHVAR